ncbi:NAD(P)H-dependent oxidoreductase [Chloroflexota bacterium]
MSKSVLFLCGSPRGKRSASLITASYLAHFLDHDYEFVNVARASLSTDPAEAEPAFLEIVGKMQAAGAVIWTFGAWGSTVLVGMQYLLDKLFTQEGYDFCGRVAAAVMTSVGLRDDLILDRTRFLSGQLGFGYLGDVSAVGNPFWGYTMDVERTEDSCRILAGQMNRALADGYVPARQYPPLERRYLSPRHRGSGFAVDGPAAPKDGDKTILVITGHRLAEDPANASVVESIRRYSRNKVEVIALQGRNVGPCLGCYLCDFREEGLCVLKDEYEAIKRRLHEVDGIVYVGTCASGLVDCYLKAFLERTWGISHRPSLKGRYGFAVATGGGPLEAEAGRHLRDTLNGHGARCIATLTPSAAVASGFAATLRRTVEDLDRALDEEWQIADRFSTRAKSRVFRDLVAENGMTLRADYKFYKENRMFDVPSPGGLNAALWWLFRSEKLRRRMMAIAASRVADARERRLAAYLGSGGRLGRGTQIPGAEANTDGRIQ